MPFVGQGYSEDCLLPPFTTPFNWTSLVMVHICQAVIMYPGEYPKFSAASLLLFWLPRASQSLMTLIVNQDRPVAIVTMGLSLRCRILLQVLVNPTFSLGACPSNGRVYRPFKWKVMLWGRNDVFSQLWMLN